MIFASKAGENVPRLFVENHLADRHLVEAIKERLVPIHVGHSHQPNVCRSNVFRQSVKVIAVSTKYCRLNVSRQKGFRPKEAKPVKATDIVSVV